MFRTELHTVFAAIGLAAAALTLGCQAADEIAPSSTVAASPSIPVKQSCVVGQNDFAGWFASGSVTRDGPVTPPSSLASFDSTCEFYDWSWRMFLWQLSENSGGYVFGSAPFYDLNESNELVSNGAGDSGRRFVRGGKLEDMDRTGQAGLVSGVLMSQGVDVNPDGSLVYYAIHVNDLYAYMVSGVNSGELTGVTQFPTTAEQRDAIVNYARRAYGASIDDADVLAMELKSSWVKADSTMDLSDFVTITADVPRYTQSSDQEWTWDGTSLEEGVTLACVGFHIVGSANGHPEMIWATFEHLKNAPNADYYYLDENDVVQLQRNWNEDGTPVEQGWLFMDGVSREPSMNQMHMELTGNDIRATTGETISPSNTMRTHPWGGAPDSTSATNNTEIISLNQSIASMLADGDVRKNYVLVGATWTRNGVPGVGLQLPEVVGSLTLANSSMETYFQYKNCFDCHKGGQLAGLSHIFGSIEPLPKR